mgnify:CR=1 FL=1
MRKDIERFLTRIFGMRIIAVYRKEYLRQMLNLDKAVSPTPLSSHVAAHSAVMFSLFCVPFSVMVQSDAWHARNCSNLHRHYAQV